MSNRVTDEVKTKLEPVVARLADYVRNVLREAPRSRLKGQLARRLNSGDLFELLFPELQEERDQNSDILSKWVGESEQKLAAAFQEAQEDGAVLVFDEVDRRDAQHSWEATQVNEFLQQLEAYRGAIICTTNLWLRIPRMLITDSAVKPIRHSTRSRSPAPA